ncbi:MAG TPA: CrcB family protein [Bacteroidia bacterium]|nr:CrcB family protein [Bacteroidia bacterium]
MNYLLVFLGGGLGSVLRFAIGLIMQKFSASLPLATLLANLIACLVFALTLSIPALKQGNHASIVFFVLSGFCGGLSTFSAFSYESFMLFRNGMALYALGNITLSVFLCLALFYLILK